MKRIYLLVICGSFALAGEGARLGADEILVESALLTISQQAEVSARERGVIAQIHVREGDQVTTRQFLGKLDDEESHLAVERTRIELERATSLAANDLKLRLAEKELEIAESDLGRATKASQRLSNSVSEAELDRLRLDVERATLHLEQSRFEAATAKLAVRIQENALRSAEEGLRRRQLVAPIAGTVVAVHRHLGEAVEIGQTVLRVIDTTQLRAEGFVKVDVLVGDLVGRPVRFNVRLLGAENETFHGELIFVHPEVDPVTRQIRVWARISNVDGKLRPGLSGSMTIADSATRTASPE